VALTPEAVELLVGQGHQVVIESGAGVAANYHDTDYSENGGTITQSVNEVYHADVVLKIAPPTPEETDLFKGNQVVISSLQLSRPCETYIRFMLQKRITAISFELIKDNYDCYPIVRSMSQIAGNTSTLIAGEYLSNVNNGKGVMLGGVTGITPTEVVILGAGTAGEFAARAALGMGAFVKIMDNSIQRLERIQSELGMRLHTSVLHPRVLRKALKSADVLIGALNLMEEGSHFYVTEEMISRMKKGSIVIDISIDQGGCIETSECRTHADPVFTKHGVIHYCVPNIPSRVARTASIALSNVLAPILLKIGKSGGLNTLLKSDVGLRHGVYVYNGILTNSYLGGLMGISSQDINLLMAAF
jgi:alanine dehydrogenase